MPGRWDEEQHRRERERRERERRARADRRDRSQDADDNYWVGGEPRSFHPEDRVFGEDDYGAEYNKPPYETWRDGPDRRPGAAARRGGGRYYGDDGRSPIYREEYGQGGREYGEVPPGYDEGRRFGTREADQRWSRRMRRPLYGEPWDRGIASGGTGGYDYERGYGDGGRGYDRDRGDRGWEREFEARARDAGAFFRRTGERLSRWFDGLGDEDYGGDMRGARGLGPQGYKRSDERISEDAHQTLTDDPWLDASHVGVSVSGGEVTLSGTVVTREGKHRAERLIEDLPGVGHVQNNLRVERGGYFTSAERGYGDSVEEARLRGKAAEPQPGEDAAATRTTTRRT